MSIIIYIKPLSTPACSEVGRCAKGRVKAYRVYGESLSDKADAFLWTSTKLLLRTKFRRALPSVVPAARP